MISASKPSALASPTTSRKTARLMVTAATLLMSLRSAIPKTDAGQHHEYRGSATFKRRRACPAHQCRWHRRRLRPRRRPQTSKFIMTMPVTAKKRAKSRPPTQVEPRMSRVGVLVKIFLAISLDHSAIEMRFCHPQSLRHFFCKIGNPPRRQLNG